MCYYQIRCRTLCEKLRMPWGLSVGFFFSLLYPWEKWKLKVKVTYSCLTLCDTMDCTVHGILQDRILEWVAFPFSRGSSKPRDWTQVSRIASGFFPSSVTKEAHYIPRCIKLNIWNIEICGGNMNGPVYFYIFLGLLNKLHETQHSSVFYSLDWVLLNRIEISQ